MSLCQRTNVGYAEPLARWLSRHGAVLLVDDRLPDTIRYQLVPAGAPIDQARARFRTPRELGRAIETPGGLAWG